MFWGLVLEPGKRYAQTVDTAFHVSMACLEAKPSDNELTSVILDHNDREFILCSLHRQKVLQSQLDLNFTSGEKIAFLTSGQGKVHLTGYLIEQDEDDDEDYELPEDAEVEESLSDKIAGKLGASAKRKKKQDSPKEDPKKQKLSNAVDDDESDFPSSDMDSDIVEGSGDESDDDDGGGVEEEDEDDEEEEDDDSDEEDSDEATPGKKKAATIPFSSPGSTPFQKKLQGKGKQPTAGVQKNEKSPKSVAVTSAKKEKVKSPVTGNINGTPGDKSGKKKKNKNKKIDSTTNTPAKVKSPGAEVTQAKTPKQTLTGGVLIEESKVGNGPVAKQGSYVTVYYTGRLKNNNKTFDTLSEGNGFKFRLGGNEVIRGWDIGIPGMKVGGKRKITIPPQMAYGSKGSPPAIPPNSSLVFDVELLNVK